MKRSIALFVLLVGCRTTTHQESTLVMPEPSLVIVRWFNMTEGSQLYRATTSPRGTSPQEAHEYIQGYRCGWIDQGEDHQWILDDNGELHEVTVPASVYIENESDIFKRGYADGRERARKDLKTYEAQVRKEVKAQNK